MTSDFTSPDPTHLSLLKGPPFSSSFLPSSSSSGDLLTVLQQHPTGWWKGKLLTRVEGGKVGLFPMEHVSRENVPAPPQNANDASSSPPAPSRTRKRGIAKSPTLPTQPLSPRRPAQTSDLEPLNEDTESNRSSTSQHEPEKAGEVSVATGEEQADSSLPKVTEDNPSSSSETAPRTFPSCNGFPHGQALRRHCMITKQMIKRN